MPSERTRPFSFAAAMEEAMQSDRIIVLKDGKVFSDKSPKDLFENREIIANAGLEVPTVIELRNKLIEAGMKLSDPAITVQEIICQLK